MGVEFDRVYGAGHPLVQVLFVEVKVMDLAHGPGATARFEDFLKLFVVGKQAARQRRALEHGLASFAFENGCPGADFRHVLVCVARADVLAEEAVIPAHRVFDLSTGAEVDLQELGGPAP